MGNSMPRSPRATMIAPATSMMPSTFSTAIRVSIFATSSGPAGAAAVARARRSSASRTNDTAMKSTPASTAASA